MPKWKYTIKSGTALRDAIDNEDVEQVVKCLLLCYKELSDKLSKEDKDWFSEDIEEAIDTLDYIDRMGVEDEDEDEINDHLYDFYDLCDDARAFVAL